MNNLVEHVKIQTGSYSLSADKVSTVVIINNYAKKKKKPGRKKFYYVA